MKATTNKLLTALALAALTAGAWAQTGWRQRRSPLKTRRPRLQLRLQRPLPLPMCRP